MIASHMSPTSSQQSEDIYEQTAKQGQAYTMSSVELEIILLTMQRLPSQIA